MTFKMPERGGGPRVVLAVTSAQSLKLMTGFPEYLSSKGWDVHVVASSVPNTPFPEGVTFQCLPMKREPSLLHDLASLTAWIRLLVRLRPNLVVAGTPKAGLLGMVSAFVTGVPTRIYLLRGLRLTTESGLRRRMLWLFEWICSSASTRVQAVSSSLRDEYIEHRLCEPEKVVVLGAGSSNGVEIVDAGDLQGSATVTRDSARLEVDTPVVGFVGRLARDKGLLTLLSAVRQLRDSGVSAQILLVGPEEPHGSLGESLRVSRLEPDAVTWVGAVPDARPYYPTMDVLCLPTRREGFPNVVLEAAVQGVPAVVSEVTGAVDSVIDRETGWLFSADDTCDLAARLREVLEDADLRLAAGRKARERVTMHYDRTVVWARTERFFRRETGLTTKEEDLI